MTAIEASAQEYTATTQEYTATTQESQDLIAKDGTDCMEPAGI